MEKEEGALRVKKLWLLLPICLLLQGCWDSKDIDNRIIAVTMGITSAEKGQIELWLRFPRPETTTAAGGKGGSSLKGSFVLVKQKAPTVAAAIDRTQLKLSKGVDIASVQTILITEDIAKKGVYPYLEFAIRNRLVPMNTLVAVVQGSLEPLLGRESPTGESAGMIINNFFEEHIGGAPRKTKASLWNIYSRIYNPMEASVVPRISANDETLIKSIGTVYFSGDQMAGTLTPKESLIYALMRKKIRGAEIETVHKADVRITDNTVHVKESIGKDGRPIIHVRIRLVFSLMDLSNKERLTRSEIEQAVNQVLERRAKSVFAKTQKAGADIFGFGNHFRGRLEPREYKKWPEMYKHAKIDFQVESELRNTGLKE